MYIMEKREVKIIFLIDATAKMSTYGLAEAINDVKCYLKDQERYSTKIYFSVCAISFNSEARYIENLGPEFVPLELFNLPDIEFGGYRDTAKAFMLLGEVLHSDKNFPRKSYRPICVFISCGLHTSIESEYQKAFNKIEESPWGKRAIRISVGLADFDKEELQNFANLSNFQDRDGVHIGS